MIVDDFFCACRQNAYPQSFLELFRILAHRLALDRLHQNMQVVVEPGVLSA
jgi:hypothetical protein